MKKKRVYPLGLLGGLFFALCTVAGLFYASGKDLYSVTRTQAKHYLFAAFLLFAVYSCFLNTLLRRNYALPTLKEREPHPAVGFFKRHIAAITFVILLIAWIPYQIMVYPGSASYDACRQLEMFLGLQPMANNHPVFSTLLLGAFFRLGQRVSGNFGVGCVVLAQITLGAAAVALCQRKILALTRSVRFCVITLLFFALNPVWGLYQQTLVKDVPFYAFFLFYSLSFIELTELVTDKDQNRPLRLRTCAGLVLSGSLCCLMRHGEVIIIILSLGLLAVFALRERNKLLILLALTVLLGHGGSKALAAITDAGASPTRATFSLFFQQTALYMKKYPKDVTPEQYAAIDGVLSAGEIGELYNPLLSDPVKATYKTDADAGELARYFRAWFQMLLRHPKAYADSFLHFTVTYLDPFHIRTNRIYYVGRPSGDVLDDLGVHYVFSRALRTGLRSYADVCLETPGIKQMFSPGTYVWVCTACFLLLWQKRRYRQMVVFSLPFLHLLMCIASPVAGCIRYSLPFMAAAPLMAAWTWAAVSEAAAPREKQKSSR